MALPVRLIRKYIIAAMIAIGILLTIRLISFSEFETQQRLPIIKKIGNAKPNQPGSVEKNPAEGGRRIKQKKISNQDATRKEAVRNMMRHAWGGYKKYTWGADELNPLSKQPHVWSGGSMLFTPLDSMDTLYIMGLEDEFKEAKEIVIERLNFNVNAYLNTFETIIRVLGGLLAAYDLDGDKRILQKAVELGDALMNIFDTPTGLPKNQVNLNARSSNAGAVGLATVGTMQLEFQYLSDVSGDPKYAQKALYAFEQIRKIGTDYPGLYPNSLSVDNINGHGNNYGIAGEADSYYEYLLKLSISVNSTKYRRWYDESSLAVEKHLLRRTGPYTYLPDLNAGNLQSQFHHLSCFAGGMFAMGAKTQPDENSERLFKIGQDVTETCYLSYQSNPSKLGAEWTSVGNDALNYPDRAYLLRPETVESIFYMWRYTHDEKYREWGWNVVQALESKCKDDAGYHGLENNGNPHDRQESFFLAETLKYLYLLFEDDSVIPFDEYVFNTEAHVLSIRGYGRRSDSNKWVPLPY